MVTPQEETRFTLTIPADCRLLSQESDERARTPPTEVTAAKSPESTGPCVDSKLRDRHAVLAAAVAGNFGQFGARVVISPFVLAIAGAFHVTKGDVGVVLSLMWGAFALLQFPSGVLADRYGERRIVLLALGATAVGSLLVALAPNFPVFALAAVALGAGAGLYFSVGAALLSKKFEQQGRALSIHSAGSPLAGLTLPIVATAVAAVYDWRVGVALGSIVAVVAFTLLFVFVDETPPPNPNLSLRNRLHPRTVVSLLRRPDFAFTTLVAALGMYVFQSFVSFFPTFLREYHNFSESRASVAFGVAFVLIAVTLPFVGSLADSYGNHVGLVAPMVVTAVGFSVLVVSPSRLVTYTGVAAVGLGITWSGTLQSRFMDLFPDDERATGFGLARTVFVLLGAVGNAATGYLAQSWGWPVAIGVVVAVMLAAAGLVAVNRLLGLGL
jgi:YNFM family putative membrane transporter